MSIIGWKQIYTHTVTGAAETSITIPDLHGDVDLVYKLEARIVNGYNGTSDTGVKLNNDGAANYGVQNLYGTSTSTGAGRTNPGNMVISHNTALGHITQSSMIIQAKSGYVRTAINEIAYDIATTAVDLIGLYGFSWNNTSDEITSLVVLADQANGLGIGSQITLWARATLTVTPPAIPIEWR